MSPNPGKQGWTTKKDRAPRGLIRYGARGWGIRYTCGLGHVHQEFVGRLQGDARDAHDQRRQARKSKPAWCPVQERAALLDAERVRIAAQDARVDFATFAAAYEKDWHRDHRGGNRQASTIRHLVRHFGSYKVDEIAPADVKRWQAGLSVKPATVNRLRAVLQAILAAAGGPNPAKGIKRLKEPAPREKYILPSDKSNEERELLAALSVDLRPVVVLALHTGLRRGELLALEWRDVDGYTKRLRVRESKGGGHRDVPLNSEAIAALQALPRLRPVDPSERVIHVTVDRLDEQFRRAVRQAHAALVAAGEDASRLSGFHFHDCRHTFASRLVMAGVDLYRVQRLLGHASSKMTERYAHLSPDFLGDAVARIEPALRTLI